jgi:hypothetical protein
MAAPVFDRVQSERPLEVLRQLGDRVRPLSAAAERTLPVPDALAPLLPHGGLQRGTTVATTGSAASSLALTLAGPATAGGSWCAVVGLAHLGLLAAAELGVALERTVLVAVPEPGAWPSTVAALLDAFDVVLVQPMAAMTPTTHRRLMARARDRGAVLIPVGLAPGAWGQEPDLVVSSGASRWEGLGVGHGRLRARQVEVEVRGRRAAARVRRASLWLPGPDGRIATAEPPVPVAPPGPEATWREVG